MYIVKLLCLAWLALTALGIPIMAVLLWRAPMDSELWSDVEATPDAEVENC